MSDCGGGMEDIARRYERVNSLGNPARRLR